MKKLLLLLAVASVSVMNANAFDVGLGLKGGLGMSMGTFNKDAKEMMGANADGVKFTSPAQLNGRIGLALELGIIENFAIQPELAFAFNNGVGYKRAMGDDYRKMGIGYNSVDLDLFFKGRFNVNDTVRLYLMAGPAFSFGVGKVTAKQEESRSGNKTSSKEKVSFKDEMINPNQIGIAGELGAEFKVGPGAFIVGVRTKWNLTSAYDIKALKADMKDQGVTDEMIDEMVKGYKGMKHHTPVALQLGYGFRF